MSNEHAERLHPVDLRGILHYVPQFRDQTFVIAVDGSVAAHENFQNIITDIAVLKSLAVRVVLVHGIGKQIKMIAEETTTPISDAYGSGPTDETTLKLALRAAGEVGHRIVGELQQNGLTSVEAGLARAVPMGIVDGVDHQHTGKLDKVDLALLERLMERDTIPVFGPVLFGRDGESLRVNSDLLAADLAARLDASKLIFLTPHPGLMAGGETYRNIPMEDLGALLKRHENGIDERVLSKARYAYNALEKGVTRAHILDGRVDGCLLIEVFDKVGLGTMIHANEYQQIRAAKKRDIEALHGIIRNAARSDALRYRTREALEHHIENFFVYEVDESLIGCTSISDLDDGSTAELGAVLVQPFYQGKGVGKKLVEYALKTAAKKDFKRVIALSTQTATFFTDVCGFKIGTTDDLPEAKKADHASNGRQSKVLIKEL
ncbi:amino-acid N-acetyltransferase [Rubellicoccus peritrichatus]|uniref:amino-acid N-acetyltransferase n=1 Tax=Rubellicoccus peritrichatus TaxID=3080537 RepID=A0AAQ3LCM9_9BACT|nr:amino-acid N-acetyltransferase [Puniceicoccus sp. CR14]WOO43250.1 amino-acid N-acetyltransferase [Puniceicoccus sp. CR14]